MYQAVVFVQVKQEGSQPMHVVPFRKYPILQLEQVVLFESHKRHEALQGKH